MKVETNHARRGQLNHATVDDYSGLQWLQKQQADYFRRRQEANGDLIDKRRSVSK